MIPKKHLEEMGFKEIKPRLFMKEIGQSIQIYRDYRKQEKYSYAYKSDKILPASLFKELRSIEKIECYVDKGTLSAYC